MPSKSIRAFSDSIDAARKLACTERACFEQAMRNDRDTRVCRAWRNVQRAARGNELPDDGSSHTFPPSTIS